MKNSNYYGPNLLETTLFKKHCDKLQFKERIYKFSLYDKILSYKTRKGLNPHKIFSSKDLKSFKVTVSDNQKNNFYSYGFQIQTTKKNYVLFTEKYEDYLNWVRILKYFFYKIDVFNQFSGYSLSGNQIMFDSKSVILPAEENHKTSKRNERGVEYKYYLVPKSTLIKSEPPSNLPPSNQSPSNLPQTISKFNDGNQKVGVEFPDNYQGDNLEFEQIESPLRIEKKKVISNVITHLQTEQKNDIQGNVNKNFEINNRHIQVPNYSQFSEINISKIKSDIIINKEALEIGNINCNSPLKPSFLLDLKKSNKLTNVNFIRNIIERKKEIEVNDSGKSTEDILQNKNIKLIDNSIKVSNQANALNNERNFSLKIESDNDLISQFKNNSNNLLNGKSNMIISQRGLSEIDEKAEFHRRELSNDSKIVLKEKLELYDLEKAFIKNTNKISFGNKANGVQHRDYIAHYIGNEFNGLGKVNVSYKRVVSNSAEVFNIEDKIKENNKSSVEVSKKLNLNDQKIFDISNDFEVENKVKTKISMKIPLVISNDIEENVINTSFNKCELNSDHKVNFNETCNTINQNNLINNEQTQLNLIYKQEVINTDQTSKLIMNKSVSPKKSLNESIVSNGSSINASTEKAKKNSNEKDKIQVNNTSEYQEKRDSYNWTNNQSSIRDYTEIYLKNTKKVIEKKSTESSNITKPVKSFHEMDFADAWINENNLIYPIQKRTVSSESKNNLNIKASNKKVRLNTQVELNKDQHTEINKHNQIKRYFNFNDDNLHVHPDENLVNIDEKRAIFGIDKKGKQMSHSFYQHSIRKNEDKTNSAEKQILNSVKTKKSNRKSTTLVEDHHLIPDYSFHNNDENEGKTIKIEEPIKTIQGNKVVLKEVSLEKRIEKEEKFKVKFKIDVEEECHESTINKKNIK